VSKIGSTRKPAAGSSEGRDRRLYLGRKDGTALFFSGEGSIYTIGPPGTGKSRGLAIPNALNYPGSLLVTDPKGELARLTLARRRDHLGQSIALLDPFGITGLPSNALNPLDGLATAVTAGRGFMDEGQRLARQLVPENPEEKTPFWRDGGRQVILCGLLDLALSSAWKHAQETVATACTLPNLYTWVWQNWDSITARLDKLIEAGGLYEGQANALKDMAGAGFTGKNNVITFLQEARQSVSIFAPGEALSAVTGTSDVDLSALLTGRLTVYLVLPPEYVASHGKWMGLLTTAAIETIAMTRTEEAGNIVFLLDEFANLGKVEGIAKAIAELRYKGLRCWLLVQDPSQLPHVYGGDLARALMHQAEVKQVLGVRSWDLAQEIEHRAGTMTVKTSSFGMPDPTQIIPIPSENVSEVMRPVLPAHEIMAMPVGTQILLRHGLKPMIAELPLHDIPNWR
jgi:type IV secretion system protein VirD4